MSSNFECEKNTIVHQLVEVEAEITIKPIVKHGKPKVSCYEADVHSSNSSNCGKCKRKEKSCGKCTYSVSQIICVEIPVNFDVEVDVDKGITKCGKPHIGPCDDECNENIDSNEDDYSESTLNQLDKPKDDVKFAKKSRKYKKLTKKQCKKYDETNI